MEPNVVTKPAFKVVGMKVRGKAGGNEIKDLWGAFNSRMHEIKYAVGNKTAYGVSTEFDYETKEFDYIACIAAEMVDEVPEGMVSLDIPQGTFAVFTTTLPTMIEDYENAYNVWLPNSGYERQEIPDYEEYGPEFDPMDPNSEFLFHVPLKGV
jgi:AraC family transcriptional regulator